MLVSCSLDEGACCVHERPCLQCWRVFRTRGRLSHRGQRGGGLMIQGPHTTPVASSMMTKTPHQSIAYARVPREDLPTVPSNFPFHPRGFTGDAHSRQGVPSSSGGEGGENSGPRRMKVSILILCVLCTCEHADPGTVKESVDNDDNWCY